MITLQCGSLSIDVFESVIATVGHTPGCWMCGLGDLYDLGFRHSELMKHGLEMRVGHTTVLKIKSWKEDDVKDDGKEQAGTPADQTPR